MPSMKLGKKFLLAKKAWKGFTSTLRTKLHKLKRTKSIKKAKTRLNSTLSTILRRRRRRRRPPRPSSPPSRSKSTRSRIQAGPTSYHVQKGFAPVFVDELFKEPVSAPPVAKHGLEYYSPSTSKVVVGKADSSSPPPGNGGVKTPSAGKAEKLDEAGPSAAANGRRKSPVAMATAPKASPATAEVVAADHHQQWGVDARAEQFILQFREELRLQRQRSYREYQEMLARGVK
ncbi:hypothetical protein ACLOJK_011488 [Asimina triloba]